MLLKNARVTLEIADNTGVLLALRDECRGVDFIASPLVEPFRVTLKTPGGPREYKDFTAFHMTREGDTLDLHWRTSRGVAINAHVSLLEDGVAFTSDAVCDSNVELQLVEYPIIGGMGSLGENSEMAHSFATGLLVKNPLDNFAPGEGVRYAPYPESFSGASMQFYAYYGLGRGGLCFMAQDGESHQKWLNLYRGGKGMVATMMYGFEDMGEGKPASAPYPFVVRMMDGKGWQEAAAMYKRWAIKQKWCAKGPIASRPHSEWLMKKVGLTTFGVNAGLDRAQYIKKYHQDVGTSVFHVLGPDWTNTPQTFKGINPGGLPDWVPTKFCKETLNAIKEVGDYFAPFEFDMMAHPNKSDSEQVKESQNIFPQPPHTYSVDPYHFSMLCPRTPYAHHVHVKRDEQVVRESDADAMYYDISANNLLHICLSKDHGHPVGGGNVITEGYKTLYRDTQAACEQVKGQYFPLGTEMINEVFLPEIDYYQARAGAQPCSALELWPFKKLINTEKAALIPLFAYVYHEYGAVRMDGWGKLVEETGDLYYDNAAKIYLWGGLYELNYEYSPAEALEGVETGGEEHYYVFSPFGYEYSKGRARYLRQFAALRTGVGNRYLAYGEMTTEPEIATPLRVKHYHHYNHGEKEIFSGDIHLPAVRVSAYKSCDGQKQGYAVFLANTELDKQNVTLSIDPKDYPGATKATLYSDFDPDHDPTRTEMGDLTVGALSLSLDIPARRVVMLEIT